MRLWLLLRAWRGIDNGNVHTCLFGLLQSTLQNGAGWASTITGVAASRRSPQLQAVACGSRSIMTELAPAFSAAMERERARVVLPAPPFWAISAIVLMATSKLFLQYHMDYIQQGNLSRVSSGWSFPLILQQSSCWNLRIDGSR